MNIFDGIQKSMFNIATATFGYSATWLPSEDPNGPEYSAEVLYKGPTNKKEFDDNDFNIENDSIEFQFGSFPGLFENVAKALNEKVKIKFDDDNEREFWVSRCEKLFDGKTIKAFLKPL